jgi:hypothetical protein
LADSWSVTVIEVFGMLRAPIAASQPYRVSTLPRDPRSVTGSRSDRPTASPPCPDEKQSASLSVCRADNVPEENTFTAIAEKWKNPTDRA